MHPVVNHLIQLQELNLIRDERKVAGGKQRQFDELEESIASLAKELPDESRSLYGKLHKKHPITIVPVSQGICVACGLKLPISLVQQVKIGADVHQCPSCARFLYFPETQARGVGRGSRRGEPRKVGISRFSDESLMVPRMEADDRDGVIRGLALAMGEAGFVEKADQLIEAAIQREEIMSTAIDHGLAFPHVRGIEGGGLSVAVGTSAKGVRFSDDAKQLTRIVFFIVIPTAASAFYLKLLAGLAETFSDAQTRKALLAEKEPAGMWKQLIKLTRATVK